MYRILPIFIMILSCGFLAAQPTITNAIFPEVGDVGMTGNAPMPGVDLGTTGGSQTWDWADLNALTMDTIEVNDAASGTGAGLFPNADLRISAFNGENYIEVTNNQVKAVGFIGQDPLGFGVELDVVYNPAQTLLETPISFMDTKNFQFGFIEGASPDILPPGFLDSLGIEVDSLRVTYTADRIEEVDAWGTMIIPNGSYEVLRIKATEYTNTKVEGLVEVIPGFPQWVDPATLGVNLPGAGPDTLQYYSFLSPSSKTPIAEVTVDFGSTEANAVTFKIDDEVVSVKDVAGLDVDMKAVPNPAINEVDFQINGVPSGNYTLKLYNILGKVILEQEQNLTGKDIISSDISALNRGTYIYSLTDSDGNVLGTQRLFIIRP